MSPSNLLRERAITILIALGCLAFIVPLVAYSIMGSHMRQIGDDYCYEGVVNERGFLRAQWESLFEDTPYSGNRYSSTLFSAISGVLGPRAYGFVPALSISLWVVALTYILHRSSKLVGVDFPWLPALLIGVSIVFLTLYQAPVLDQILYWRSGLLPYLAPLVAGTVLIGLLLWQVGRQRVSALALGATFMVAFLAGGFSETAASLQLTVMLVLVLATWVWDRAGGSGLTVQAYLPVLAGLAGTVLAVSILAFAPAAEFRQVKMGIPTPFLQATADSFRRSIAFVKGSLTGLPVPSIVTVLVASLVTGVSSSSHRNPSRPRVGGFWLPVVILGVTILFIAATMGPSAIAEGGPPQPRALITARHVMTVSLAVLGIWIGARAAPSLYRFMGAKLPAAAAVWLMLAVLWIYPLRGNVTGTILSDLTEIRNRAAAWDARDAEIRAAAGDGMLEIEVVQLWSPIRFVAELGEDPTSWYNQCAATYYSVTTIRAIEADVDAGGS